MRAPLLTAGLLGGVIGAILGAEVDGAIGVREAVSLVLAGLLGAAALGAALRGRLGPEAVVVRGGAHEAGDTPAQD